MIIKQVGGKGKENFKLLWYFMKNFEKTPALSYERAGKRRGNYSTPISL